MKKATLLALALSVIATPSFALEYITGRVTLVEPTYLPGLITLQMDAGNAACPAGTYLRWQKSNENNRSAYASLLAALVARSTINFVINDGDTTCTGQFLHVMN